MNLQQMNMANTFAQTHGQRAADLMESLESAGMEFDNDWQEGAARYEFDDGSTIVISGTDVQISGPATVTAEGVEEIKAILIDCHKQGAEIVESSDMMAAWAKEAESHHDETGEAYIEIGCFEAVSGHTETYTIEGIA